MPEGLFFFSNLLVWVNIYGKSDNKNTFKSRIHVDSFGVARASQLAGYTFFMKQIGSDLLGLLRNYDKRPYT